MATHITGARRILRYYGSGQACVSVALPRGRGGRHHPFDAIRALRVGGVIVNGTSTWRTDQLAYGGIKSSGIGREGPRYAMRDMTEERLVLFNL